MPIVNLTLTPYPSSHCLGFGYILRDWWPVDTFELLAERSHFPFSAHKCLMILEKYGARIARRARIGIK